MSRRLPPVSGRELVRALQRGGFVVLRQRGSHVSMERRTAAGYWRTVVPLHREIRPGTLGDILSQAGLTRDDLAELLQG
jgi:predicted RNA binding protein YcfA (HicA-like mRNA interferase family)